MITVSPISVAFTANPTYGLVPLTVSFTCAGFDIEGNAITNWNWSFGDGSTSTAQNPSHTYTTPGTFAPALIATNNIGGTITGFGPAWVSATLISSLYNFTATSNSSPYGNNDGANPDSGLLLSGHILYGTTYQGGNCGCGTVFALNTDGSGFTNLHSFTGGSDGGNPAAALILAGNTLYGTAVWGGSGGYGTVFALNPNGTDFTNLYSFTALDPTSSTSNDGATPVGGLILSGNTLYGTTPSGGSGGSGTVFAVNTNGAGFTNLHSFTAVDFTFPTNSDGANPRGGLILSGNTLFGTTYVGGNGGSGTVFSVNTSGAGFTNLYSFTALDATSSTNKDGATPVGGLILSGNTLYGTAYQGGSGRSGTVFAVNTNGTGFTNLHSFTPLDPTFYTNNDGAYPLSGLILSGNTLYGTASYGGNWGCGTVFALNTNGTGFTNLDSFTGGSDGVGPGGGLILSGNTLFGTALQGGTSGNGTLFSLILPVGPVPLQIGIASFSLSGANLVLNGTNGRSGATYYVLTSTNLTLPLSQWMPVATNVLSASGSFTITATNTVTRASRKGFTFYRSNDQFRKSLNVLMVYVSRLALQ